MIYPASDKTDIDDDDKDYSNSNFILRQIINTKVCKDTNELHEYYCENNNLKIFHLNIRGIKTNFDELMIILTDTRLHFDMIILTETQLNNDSDQYNIQGYETYHMNNKLTTHDGISVFIKHDAFELYTVRVNHLITQANAIVVEATKNKETYNFLAIYRSPSGNCSTFIEELSTATSTMNANHNLILGDINININESGIESESKVSYDYLNTLAANGFFSCINNHTRVTDKSRTCIDHIFLKNISVPLKPQTAILQTAITDHYATCFGWQHYNSVNNDKMVNKENKKVLECIDYKELLVKAEQTEWTTILDENDPNIAAGKLNNILTKLINDSKYKKNVSAKNHKIKPWITKGIINSIRKRDKMYSKTLTIVDNIKYKQEYKMYRNKLNNLIKKVKNNYYKDKITQAEGDTKKVWDIINEVTNKIKPKNEIRNIQINNKLMNINESSNQIADSFVDFFSDIGKNMANDITKNNDLTLNQGIHSQNQSQCEILPNTIYLKPATEKEIIEYINELSEYTSSGIDKIDTKTLKLIKSHITASITHITNLTLESGIFPDILKTAIIKPIYKKGGKTLINNYRPISILNNIAKIIEKCIKKRINDFLEYFNLLSVNQFGFRKGVGTQDAILKLTEKIHTEMDNNNKPLAIFIDLAKAFDTVAHNKLFIKLHSLGIRGVALELIKSYLSNRQQYVEINGTLSKPRYIEFGVPQGTVLGPLLFLIYINELCNLKIEGEILSFADDTVLLFADKTWDKVHEVAENELRKVKNWFDNNLLTLNKDKTMYITFSPKTNTQPIYSSLKIHTTNCMSTDNKCNCCILKNVSNIKYLGIVIDQHLKWNHHINSLVKKLRYTLHKFYNLRYILSFSNLKMVYHATVQSLIQYGITGWGGAYDVHLSKLVTLQNTLLKIMLKKPSRYPTRLVYEESGVLQTRKLYAKFVIKHIHQNCPPTKTQNNNHRYINTRSKTKKSALLNRVNKGLTQRHAYFLGPKLYNLLPLNIRLTKSIKSFNQSCKNWLVTYPIDKIEECINTTA
jgi:Reverse transcriptase (RNA-dependent DNA polymerase)